MIRTRPMLGWLRVAITAIVGLLLLGDGSQAARAGDCESAPLTRACCAVPIADRCCCLAPAVPTPARSDVPIKPAAIESATLEPAATTCPCQLNAPTNPAQQPDRPVQGGANPDGPETASNSILEFSSLTRIAPRFDGPQPSAASPGLPLYLRIAHLRF